MVAKAFVPERKPVVRSMSLLALPIFISLPFSSIIPPGNSGWVDCIPRKGLMKAPCGCSSPHTSLPSSPLPREPLCVAKLGGAEAPRLGVAAGVELAVAGREGELPGLPLPLRL